MIAYGSDLHLTRLAWKSRKDLEGDSFRALRDLCSKILARPEIRAIVLGGDIFDDAKVDGPTLEAFSSFVDTLFERGVNVYFTQGNHDRDPQNPIAQVQGAVHIHKQLEIIDGLRFYGLDWMPREELQLALKEVPPCDFLVLHGMAEHLIGFEASCDFCVDDVPTHVRNILVGDIHVQNITQIRNNGVCISSGALHPCSVSEGGVHGVYLIAPGRDYEFLEVDSREILRYEARTPEEFEIMAARLPGIQARSVPNWEPIVEVKYGAELSQATGNLPALYPGIRFFTKPVAVGKLFGAEQLKQAQQGFKNLTLELSLHAAVDPKQEPEEHAFISNLLGGNAKAIIDQKVKECVSAS